MIDFFISSEAGNLGDLLSGLGIAFIGLTYFLQRKQKSARDFREKTTRTFDYARKFRGYYEDFTFYLFTEYLGDILNRNKLEGKEIFVAGEVVKGTNIQEKTRQKAFEFFVFLQEIVFSLKRNNEFDYIDEEELGKIIKSYSVQIKDFFSVEELFIAERRRTDIDGWGSISESDFANLKNYLQAKYIFLK